MSLTTTGVELDPVVPFPSSPSPPSPQHSTEPLDRTPQACRKSVLIATALLRPLTTTGVVELLVLVPSFSPQHSTEPPERTTQVFSGLSRPALTAIALLTPETTPGVELSVSVSVPSPPPSPQHSTEPLERTAQVWL